MTQPKTRNQIICIVTTASLGIGCTGVFTGNTKPQKKNLHSIHQQLDGTCKKSRHVDCPPPSVATCNPPPPISVPCPPKTLKGIEKRNGKCFSISSFDCPPNTDCGEPIAEEQPCPDELNDGERIVQDDIACAIKAPKLYKDALCPPSLRHPPPSGYDVYKREDGTCWASPPDDCPPDIPCNPPPPVQFHCPETLKE